MNGRITHAADDGTVTDVTGAVQALYDLAISSMDFRSGFWSAEDAEPVAELAQVCDFRQREEIARYAKEQREQAEVSAFVRTLPALPRDHAAYLAVFLGHEHVFSCRGRCMWPGCEEPEVSTEVRE